MGKSRILVVGATGRFGRHIPKASVEQGHPTFVLARPSGSSDPAKKELLAEFQRLGATILHAELDDHASLVAALKQVDVVICTTGTVGCLDTQLKLIEAIKQVGHIKRFLPSEFGTFDNDEYPEDGKSLMDVRRAPKKAILKAIREAAIPHTLICSGPFASFVWAPLAQIDIVLSGNVSPPREKITILGSGEGLVVATAEVDIAALTVKAADDPRTLNKRVVIRPEPNLMPFNSLVEIWETKLGHSLHKTFVPEAEVQKRVDGLSPENARYPADFVEALYWEIVSGRLSAFSLGPSDVDAAELYPDYKYLTADKYFENFVEKK